jgi:hypothetical protein
MRPTDISFIVGVAVISAALFMILITFLTAG